MRKIFIALLTLIITALICLLSVSFCIKDIIVDTLSKEVVSLEIKEKVTSEIKKEYTDIDYDTLSKVGDSIQTSSELYNITNKYFDNIIESVIKGDDVDVPKTKEEILNLINENEDILTRNGIEVSDSKKEEIASELSDGGKLDKIYKNVRNSVKKNLSTKEIELVKMYDRMTKPLFRWIIISIILIATILIAVLKKTYYRWTLNLGVSFLLSGIVLALLTPLITDDLSYRITEKVIGKASNINVNALTNIGYGFLAICALLIIIYVVGNKSDLYTNAVVSDEEGRSFALEINGIFRIISCKTGEGIKEMFDEIGRIIKSEKNQKEQSRISLDKTVKTNAGCCGSKRETKSTCRRTKKSEYCSFNRRTDSIVGETLPQSILIPANNKSLKKQKQILILQYQVMM